MKNQPTTKPLLTSALPILFLLGIILYGLVIRPYVFAQSIIPLEIVFISASFFAASQLLYLGYSWETIIANAIKKLSKGLPIVLILFAIEKKTSRLTSSKFSILHF